MKNLGFALVMVSFLSCAFITSLDPYLVNWMYFVPSLLGGVIGLIMFKRAETAHAKSTEVLEGNRAILTTSLANLVTHINELETRKEDIPTWEMRLEIDKIFRDDLLAFADARKSMIHIYGMQQYADIMSDFAAGERYINRVWSASADGYVDEVLAYVTKARHQFNEAQKKLANAHAASTIQTA